MKIMSGNINKESRYICPDCQNEFSAFNTGEIVRCPRCFAIAKEVEIEASNNRQLPMNYFNFQRFFVAPLNILNTFASIYYGTIDIFSFVSGVLMLLFMIGAFKYEYWGIKCLLASIVISAFVYACNINFIGGLVGGIILYILTNKYYDKRKDMFY